MKELKSYREFSVTRTKQTLYLFLFDPQLSDYSCVTPPTCQLCHQPCIWNDPLHMDSMCRVFQHLGRHMSMEDKLCFRLEAEEEEERAEHQFA